MCTGMSKTMSMLLVLFKRCHYNIAWKERELTFFVCACTKWSADVARKWLHITCSYDNGSEIQWWETDNIHTCVTSQILRSRGTVRNGLCTKRLVPANRSSSWLCTSIKLLFCKSYSVPAVLCSVFTHISLSTRTYESSLITCSAIPLWSKHAGNESIARICHVGEFSFDF